jgi:hypothetical protein
VKNLLHFCSQLNSEAGEIDLIVSKLMMLSTVQVVSYYIRTTVTVVAIVLTVQTYVFCRLWRDQSLKIGCTKWYCSVFHPRSCLFCVVFFCFCFFLLQFYIYFICNHHILKTLHYLYDLFKLLLLLVIGNIYMEANIELLVSISSSQIKARLKDGWVISRS